MQCFDAAVCGPEVGSGEVGLYGPNLTKPDDGPGSLSIWDVK